MKKQIEASTRIRQQKTRTAALSLASISATVVLASITHGCEYGNRVYIVGLIVISLLCGLNILYLRTRNKVFLVFYGLINAWVVIGFGLVNGFWNHAFKASLYYLHNGSLFMAPQIGSPFFEGTGILTFVISL